MDAATIIKVLDEKGFYLGGSRRMAQKYPDRVIIRSSTDYDYNGQDGDDAEKLLKALGFKPMHGAGNYNDDQAFSFWKNGKVTVILRENLNLYKKAFELVDIDAYLHRFWKSSPHLKVPFSKEQTRDYFNCLFDAVRKTL